MIARCPVCHSYEVRVHGTTAHLRFEPRWIFFGRLVLKATTVAVECSCGECLYAFIVRQDGISAAPKQDAYDQLRAAQAGIAARKPRERPTAKPEARPAPDPRRRGTWS